MLAGALKAFKLRVGEPTMALTSILSKTLERHVDFVFHIPIFIPRRDLVNHGCTDLRIGFDVIILSKHREEGNLFGRAILMRESGSPEEMNNLP